MNATRRKDSRKDAERKARDFWQPKMGKFFRNSVWQKKLIFFSKNANAENKYFRKILLCETVAKMIIPICSLRCIL